ncbi:agnoprotein [Betapolyomavirus secuchlopygerythrus]|uniref:Agnoprotein n=1 Tax=Betapolyomavirus secuchlopygerythrus TaxID=1891758 RepID=L0N1W4_9POLY|nr:agnoprotein [Betapolyomavirus secuchlopygerythrus]BAM71871.1 agnoprotein [Betapolyomavirus secuchlopygerythrus]
MVLRQLSRQASVKVGKTWTGTKRRAQRILIFILEILLDFCRGEDSVDGKKKKDSLTDNTETLTEKKES